MSGFVPRVAFLGYEGFQAMDICGPLDAFDSANHFRPGSYATVITSLDGQPFSSESGLRIAPDCRLAQAGEPAGNIDTLIIPGGAGLRRPGVAVATGEALRACAPGVRRIVSVCTGIYGLAPSGLADGCRVTTHWRYAADVTARFPALRVQADQIFLKHGRIYTSAGITAAIDLALALIEEDYGPGLAVSVARDLVVYLKRSGGQNQFSEPLQFQSRAGDRFADLAAWIVANLRADLTVEALADRAGLSPRQFNRRFRVAFGAAPAQAVEILRLDAARERLAGSAAGIDQVADAVGFASTDSFRRAFNRRFGLSPADYRARFTPQSGNFHA
jgi:transcriptional regulator GlxA family with amidase domain